MKLLACIAFIAATTKAWSETALCAIYNDDDEWCLDWEKPSVKMGWEWTQKYDATKTTYSSGEYYEIKLIPYVDSQLHLKHTFYLKNIYTNVISANLKKFR